MDNKQKKKIEFEIEDLSIEDANIELDVKMDTKVENIDAKSDDISNNSNDMTDVSNDSSEMLDDSSSTSDISEPLNDSSFDDNLGSKPDTLDELPNDGQDGLNNKNENPDTRSLKEKVQDTKDKINDTKDKIKNAPENIKNKVNDAKDKINNTKDKINNTKDKAKNAIQNRPKNMADLKDRMKGSNLKEKLKNGAKNRMKNAAKYMKNNAAESFRNSDLGQKIGKAKDTIDKTKNAIDKGKKIAKGAKKAGKAAVKAGKAAAKVAVKAGSALLKLFISTLPWSAIVIGIILLIVLIIVLISSLVPGVGGDVNEDEAYSQYSEVDKKTLTKLKKHIQKYPNADGTLAMSVVLYPYFDNLYSGNTISYLTTNENEEEEETTEEETEQDEDYDEEDYEDVEDAEEDSVPDDPYLVPLRKSKVMRRAKKVLKKLSSTSEEDFKKYLKEEYFTSDSGYLGFDEEFLSGYNGYKKMLKNVEDSNKEEFLNSVIEDIYANKEFFINYIYEAYSCSTELHSAGTVDINEMLKSNILVDVKVPSCKSAKNVWDCQSVYSNPIPLKNYVFGGTYEEFNSMDVEKTAAQMLAIKSYIVERSNSMGWGIRQDQSGNYVVTARNNTNDLVYCDVDLGCESGNTMVGDGNRKRGPISKDQREVYEKAWEKVADKYIYDKKGNKTVGTFCQSRSGVCDFCNKGSCLAHEELERYTNTSFESIIGMQYSNYAMIQIEGDFANVTVAGESNCLGTGSLDIDDSNFVYYAQSDYPNVAFCGRTLGGSGDGLCSPGSSICTSGCGLVSMTMVTATLTQNYSINPVTINQEVRVGTDCGPGISGTVGGNMFPYIAKKYGLTISSKSVSSNAINDIKKGIDEGGLIIASVCGGLKSNQTYTSGCGGHFIVVRGYEGNSVIISDPYQNGNLRSYKGCLLKKNGKCIKHKMDFSTFQNDLSAKGGTLYTIKGKVPFYELKNQGKIE